jgi:hypothetical protein
MRKLYRSMARRTTLDNQSSIRHDVGNHERRWASCHHVSHCDKHMIRLYMLEYTDHSEYSIGSCIHPRKPHDRKSKH